VPFFFDPFHNHSFGLSIFGPRGTGKSVLGNFLSAHAQKYNGYTFVFDIGGSFEENARYFDGSVLKLTLEEQSFSINPFSLSDAADNRKFLLNLIKLLMGTDDSWSYSEENQLSDLISGMYRQYAGTPLLRLRTLYALLPAHLRPRLKKWVEGGEYAALFDNPMDTLTFSRFVVFDMQGVEEHADIVQPLLYWLFYRIQSVVSNPALAGTFKLIAIDELWKYLQNAQVADFVNNAIKTGRKHLLGMLLMTQSTGDLGPQTELIRDNCKMTMFLANPNVDRAQYERLFGLNSKELDLLTTLRTREVLLKTPDYSKVLRLNLDPKSYWRFTTSGLERLKRSQAIEQHGDKAIEMLAAGAA
jgi:type IV secretion system protein VirB4